MYNSPLIVSCGGGVNSGGLLVGLQERGTVVDHILFADTGNRDAEKPETYEFLDLLSDWLVAHSMPSVTFVRNDGKWGTLEADCLGGNRLPAIAYGWRTCSDKYKVRPQVKYLKSLYGPKLDGVTVAVGIDAGESHRAKPGNNPYQTVFPLIEWGWDRDDCAEAIKQAGLPVPIKSACFFCPSSKKHEVKWLRAHHPDLYARALRMERGANLTTIKGLGRSFSWETLVGPEIPRAMPCMCFDGED